MVWYSIVLYLHAYIIYTIDYGMVQYSIACMHIIIYTIDYGMVQYIVLLVCRNKPLQYVLQIHCSCAFTVPQIRYNSVAANCN